MHQIHYEKEGLHAASTDSNNNTFTAQPHIFFLLIGVSLSKPHIDCDNSPTRGIVVSDRLCIIYPAYFAPWFLKFMYTLKYCVLQYIDVVHMCAEQLSSFLISKLSAVKIIEEDR